MNDGPGRRCRGLSLTKDRQFTRVRGFLKKKRPDLAICTYTVTGIDIIRKGSNHPLGRRREKLRLKR